MTDKAKKTLTMPPSIQTASDAQSDQVLATTVLAFCTDPFVRWAAPDPHRYLTRYPTLFNVFIRKALEHQTVYCAEGFSGVAVWLPPQAQLDEQDIGLAIQSLGVSPLQEMAGSLFEQFMGFHPQQPHWYLPLMGVEPSHQRQGVGSALLKHALMACDRDQTVAYLEASSAQNLALYERHGFEVLGTIQAGDSPPIYPMVRAPR